MDVCAKLVGVRRIQLYVVPGRYRDAHEPKSRLYRRGAPGPPAGTDRAGRRELQISLGWPGRREVLIFISSKTQKPRHRLGLFSSGESRSRDLDGAYEAHFLVKTIKPEQPLPIGAKIKVAGTPDRSRSAHHTPVRLRP